MRRLIQTLLIMLITAPLSSCLYGSGSSPASKPLSKAVLADMGLKGLKPGNPIFVRIFKEDSQLEIWMRGKGGTYKKLKSYSICNWSGKLGPKLKTGDKQAPEGFYVIRPSQLNPRSSYHLAFNLGFPNPYDKAHQRTGAHLMVHGDCKSAGCYAMTDAHIEEIYGIVREAYRGGQKYFQVHAFPFRMTEMNMLRYQGHRWYSFWRNLKEGYDRFEYNHQPPAIGVLDQRYVFNIPGEADLSGAIRKPVIIAKDSGA